MSGPVPPPVGADVFLAATELSSVGEKRITGFADTARERLMEDTHRLGADRGHAGEIGPAARREAERRFGIGRFVAAWLDALARITGPRSGR
jgi:hypothetical protein